MMLTNPVYFIVLSGSHVPKISCPIMYRKALTLFCKMTCCPIAKQIKIKQFGREKILQQGQELGIKIERHFPKTM